MISNNGDPDRPLPLVLTRQSTKRWEVAGADQTLLQPQSTKPSVGWPHARQEYSEPNGVVNSNILYNIKFYFTRVLR